MRPVPSPEGRGDLCKVEEGIRLMMPTMWSGVLLEERLEPESIVPEQFYDVLRRKRAVMPEMELALAVMERAMIDLQEYRFRTRRREQRLYMDAYDWVASNDRRWAFSFANLCELLNVPVEQLRARLIGDASPAEDVSSPYRLYGIEEAA